MQISKNLFFTSQNLALLLNALKIDGSHPRLIGGCIRDKLAGIEVKDIDIATPLIPNEVISTLSKHNIQTIPTGIKFGTVTAIIKSEKFEITTLRKDINCDGRHAKVEYTKDFAIDSTRRDFTINALSYCPFDHIIYDYHGGLGDLENQKVRFIGQPDERIREDYLRILRFFRFSSNFASTLDEQGYKACIDNKDGIKKLSKERIHAEVGKILLSKESRKMLMAIAKGGIDLLGNLKLCLNYDLPPSLNIAYALLLFENEIGTLKQELHILGFSNKMIKEVIDLIQMLNKFSNLALTEAWIDGKKTDDYLECAYYAKMITADTKKELTEKFYNKPPILPVNGDDLIKLGLKNEDIGQELHKLKIDWINSDFTLSKTELLKMVTIYD